MKRILAIVNKESVLKILSSQLGKETYQIKTAASGEEALQILESDLSDCILIDYDSPGIGGLSFCQIFKANSKFKHIPVILLTASSDSQHLLPAIDAGADDFVSKDCDISIIIAKIKVMLQMKSLYDEVAELRGLAAVKKVIASYSHEFNNPLAIAIGNLSLLKNLLIEDEQKIRLERATTALDRMATIIKEIRNNFGDTRLNT